MKTKNPWIRTETPRPPSKRNKEMSALNLKKIFTLQDATIYLRIDKAFLERLITRGVIEVIQVPDGRRYISKEVLQGLLRPVNSLNKRLKYLDELKAQVEKQITKLETKLKNNEPNENNSDRPREVRRRGRPRKQQDS